MIKQNVECKSGDTWLGKFDVIGGCAEACLAKRIEICGQDPGYMPKICNGGCNYFIYGKGSKSKNCYWEKTNRRNSPCPEGWEADEYDFYEITNYHHSDDSRPYNLNSIMHYGTGGSHCTGNGICMKGKGGNVRR